MATGRTVFKYGLPPIGCYETFLTSAPPPMGCYETFLIVALPSMGCYEISASWAVLVPKCFPVAEMQYSPNEIANYVSSCNTSHLISHVLESLWGPAHRVLRKMPDFCSPESLWGATTRKYQPKSCRSLHNSMIPKRAAVTRRRRPQ